MTASKFTLTLLAGWACAAFVCRAQDPQPSFTLSTPETETKKYVARDYITLNKTFSFKAQDGKTFSAKIDKCQLFPPTDNTYLLSDGTYSSTIPDGQNATVVGSILGQFAVGPSGAATYTIPIEIPAGINGMQPNISLVYNSNSGVGVMGQGFSIVGLSSITRMPKTGFYDGEIKGVDYDYKDNLAFDGNPMYGKIAPNELSSDNCEYSTRNESFVKIVSHGTITETINNSFFKFDYEKNTGASWYEAFTKDGVKIEFGNTNDSKLVPTGGTFYSIIEKYLTNRAVLTWYINKITDKSGNYITYEYEVVGPEVLIKQINYTGNGSNEPFASVCFSYVGSSKTWSAVMGGRKVNSGHLLKTIVVKSGSKIIRTDSFDYSTDLVLKKDYLIAVNRQYANGAKLPQKTLVWEPVDKSPKKSIVSLNYADGYDTKVIDKQWTAINLNNDGIDDLVAVFAHEDDLGHSQFQCYESERDATGGIKFVGKGPIKDKLGKLRNVSLDDIKSQTGAYSSVFFNGDSKPDFIVPYLSKTDNWCTVGFADLTNNAYVEYNLHNCASKIPPFAMADFNNDGLCDIFYIESKYDASMGGYPARMVLGNADYFNTSSTATPTTTFDTYEFAIDCSDAPQRIIANDFNMDGLVDIMSLKENGFEIYKNIGAKLNSTNGICCTQFKFICMNNNLFNSEFSALEVGDFDGDNILDFTGNKHCSSDWYIYIGGANFDFTQYKLGNVSALEEPFTEKNDRRDDCIVTDLNRDGKSDVVLVDARYKEHDPLVGSNWGEFKKYIVEVFLSTGNQLVKTSGYETTDESYSFNSTNVIGDFNGDGEADFLSYGSDLLAAAPSRDTNFHLYTLFSNNYNQGKLIAEHCGDGVVNSVDYQPLSADLNSDGTAFYSTSIKNLVIPRPVLSLTAPMSCVRDLKKVVGGKELFHQVFSYEDATFHAVKGMLGFEKITTEELINGVKSIQSVDWDLTTINPSLVTEEVMLLSGSNISKEEKVFKNFKSGEAFFSYLQDVKTTDYLKTGIYKRETFNYGDGLDGNIKLKTVFWSNGMNEKTEFKNWVAAGSLFVNQPQDVVTTKTASAQSEVYVSSFKYYPDGSLHEKINYVGDKNQVTNVYTYDKFGNVLTNTVTSNGKSYSTTNVYKPSGRFVESKEDSKFGNTVTYLYDETNGLLTSQTDEVGTTTFEYDGMGCLFRTITPDKIQTVSSVHWAGNKGEKPIGALYYKYIETSGGSPVITWYDVNGREVRRDATALNGNAVYVSTEYDTKGRVWKVSEPYLAADESTKKIASETLYDTYGRVDKVTTPTGETSYSYNGLTTKVTTPFGVTENTINAAGQLETSKTGTSKGTKSVVYTYWPSGLVKTATPEGGPAVETYYDLQGRRTKMVDPDAGIITSAYNGFGQLLWNEQRKTDMGPVVSRTDCFYLDNGQLDYETITGLDKPGVTTRYGYDDKHRTSTIEIAGVHKVKYGYDGLDRVVEKTETIDGKRNYSTSIVYDAFGRVGKEVYPSGYSVTNGYDDYGNLVKVVDAKGRTVWEAKEANARGQFTKTLQCGRENAYGYDEYGHLQSVTAGNVLSLGYVFNKNGLLESRTDKSNAGNVQSESFLYDGLNRLTTWTVNGTQTNSIAYDDAYGNVKGKSDIGYEMLYGQNGSLVHALTGIAGEPAVISDMDQQVFYNVYNKVTAVYEDNDVLNIGYGVDKQRCKGSFEIVGDAFTRYYLGNYEEEVQQNGNIRKLHYVDGGDGLAAIYVQNGAADTLYYAYTDYQGNLLAVTDTGGKILERLAYDPWGARRNPKNWLQKDGRAYQDHIFARGYTMHEHLDAFNLINMNGRVYDPTVARFLSPDPQLQSPGNWMNYNRYGYCLNNPMLLTDPTGEFFTWGINKSGLSLGLNVGYGGFGINVGWGRGFSLGAYGECGPRIGGQYFGAGASCQQSFDYNFKQGNWSTTTTLSYSVSLGSLNAGLSCSVNYDLTNDKIGGYGYGIGGGLSVNGEHGGIGINASFSSGGWDFGVGGFYDYQPLERRIQMATGDNNVYLFGRKEVNELNKYENERIFKKIGNDIYKGKGDPNVVVKGDWEIDGHFSRHTEKTYLTRKMARLYLRYNYYAKGTVMHEFFHRDSWFNSNKTTTGDEPGAYNYGLFFGGNEYFEKAVLPYYRSLTEISFKGISQ